MPTGCKLSPPGYRHLTLISSMLDKIHSLVPQRYKCSNASGDCVEVWCVPSATHVPCTKPCQNISFSTSRVFATLFLEISR